MEFLIFRMYEHIKSERKKGHFFSGVNDFYGIRKKIVFHRLPQTKNVSMGTRKDKGQTLAQNSSVQEKKGKKHSKYLIYRRMSRKDK